jgi:hypothetical protein
MFQQCQGDGGFAGTAGDDVAHHHHGYRHAVGGQQTAAIQRVADGHQATQNK